MYFLSHRQVPAELPLAEEITVVARKLDGKEEEGIATQVVVVLSPAEEIAVAATTTTNKAEAEEEEEEEVS